MYTRTVMVHTVAASPPDGDMNHPSLQGVHALRLQHRQRKDHQTMPSNPSQTRGLPRLPGPFCMLVCVGT